LTHELGRGRKSGVSKKQQTPRVFFTLTLFPFFFTFPLMKHIVVVGCGVVGLTTAYILVEKGYHVTIVATWFPGDRGANYTSPYAGKKSESEKVNGLTRSSHCNEKVLIGEQ
jgi:hypothetical protein